MMDFLLSNLAVPFNGTELINKADRIEAELHAKEAIKVERGNKIELQETQHTRCIRN
jgi:hypothetical protein